MEEVIRMKENRSTERERERERERGRNKRLGPRKG